MANYATLKAAIQQVVKTNDNNEITGALLQQSLLAMIDSLGADYQMAGVADVDTEPGTPDQNVAYIAGPGTYPNFNSLIIPNGCIGILKYNGSWSVGYVRCDQRITELLAQFIETGEISFGQQTIAESGGTGELYCDFPLCNGGNFIISVTPYGGDSNLILQGVRPNGTTVNLMPSYVLIPSGTEYNITVQPEETFIKFRLYQSSQSTATAIKTVLKAPANDYVTNTEFIQTLSNYALKANVVARINNLFNKSVFVYDGFIRPNGTESTSTSYKKSDYLPISGAEKIYIHIDLLSTSVSPCVFYDSNKQYISGYEAPTTGVQDLVINAPANAAYIRVSNSSTLSSFNVWRFDADLYAAKYIETQSRKFEKIFISNNGNDTNDGLTRETPVLTFAEAKRRLSETGTLYVCPGDYENPDFSISKFPRVIGIGKVRFIYPLLKITSANLVSGYSRVYSVQYDKSNLMSYTYFLYQHDIPDPETEILPEERHPLQKGANYRLPSTRIYKVNSIAEIENTTDRLCWYYQDGNVYFSITEGSNLATNPIIIPNVNRIEDENCENINIANINFYYTHLRLYNISGILNGVSSGMASAGPGQIQCNYCKDLQLISCEAYAAHTANGGDGVNTHNSDTTVSDRSKIELFDCWLHDNSDDGESCHENSLTIHHGGLVEYNGSGITPAVGGGSVCHGVIVRRCGGHPWLEDNAGYGFSSQGGVMECNSCLSEHNVVGFVATSQSINFVAINSVSKNNTQAFAGSITKINCATITE